MEFKNEELVARELELAGYLINNFSLSKIKKATGLSKKHIAAHIKNMMQKLKADGIEELLIILKAVQLEQHKPDNAAD
jgi:DNA-binding CsgD family transcriptional regulator